jgi:hypothetical protein
MSHTQRQSRLSHVYVARTENAPAAPEAIDPVDGLVLACASKELPLDALLRNVPCSKRDGLDRIRRLAERGLVTIHRAAATSPPALVAADALAADAQPTTSRV